MDSAEGRLAGRPQRMSAKGRSAWEYEQGAWRCVPSFLPRSVSPDDTGLLSRWESSDVRCGCGDLSPGIDGQVGATPVPSASSEWRGTTKTASTVLEQPGGPAAVPVSSMRSEVAAIRASHELTGERVERVAAALIERARASPQNPLQDMTLLAEQDG